jgi:membrane-bound lytic murein transglycosylase D
MAGELPLTGKATAKPWRGQGKRIWITALLLYVIGFSSTHGHTSPDPFPFPAALRPQVEFWKKIFATYSEDQVVIHDTRYMDKIYKVIDLRPHRRQGLGDIAIDSLKKRMVPREKERVRATLIKLHRAGKEPSNLSPEERRIWNLYRNVNEPGKFLKAAAVDRLRTQSGLKERFAKGIQVSRRYLGKMEEIFRQEGLPIELTRLPLVESCFDLRAYSRAAAAGIWQFIPATGKLYLRIDGIIDERRDPLLSTRAAAKLLQANYNILGTWPLAITAYNHGPGGMYRAAKQVKSRDIAEIIRRYRSRTFGFASKNFYAEFLAALEVEQQHRKFFGDLPLDPPLRYDEVQVKDFVPLKTAARCAGTTAEEILSLNPALDGPIRSGRAYLPRGYRLRIPTGASTLFAQRYAVLSHHEKANAQNPVFITHRVRRGETLGHIAKRYGTTVTLLKRLNGVRNERRLQIGQRLRVPTGQKLASTTHRVRRGETLGHKRYGTIVTVLKRLNRVVNEHRVEIGQTLSIPAI